MFFQELLKFNLNEIDHLSFLDQIHLVEIDKNVLDSDLSAEQHMLVGHRHGSIDSRDDQDTSIHLGGSGDHILDIIDVSRTIDMSIVSCIGLIL